MSDNDLVALLREARAELNVLASYAEDPAFVWPSLGLKVRAKAQRTMRDRIDAALEAHGKIEWQQVSPTTQEAVVVQPDTFNVAVERMVLTDGNVGWWGKYKGSTIGCFDTEEEAKAACLKAVKDVAECFEKIAKRNKRLK